MRGRFVGVAFVALASVATSGGDAAAEERHELKHDGVLDGAVTATAVGLLIGSEIVKPFLGPRSCRWCDRDGASDRLNGLDRATRSALRWEHPTTAARISDVLGFLVTPSTSLGTLWAAAAADGADKGTPLDILIVVETVAVSEVVNQAAKFTFARERPNAHARRLRGEPSLGHVEDNLSFYSGHTSFSFTMGAASGTVASLRGYDLAPLVWATSLSVAAVTAYLHIAADKHYLTDVLTGAVVGSAIGVLLPLAFHGRRSEDASASPLPAPPPSTPMIGFGGAF